MLNLKNLKRIAILLGVLILALGTFATMGVFAAGEAAETTAAAGGGGSDHPDAGAGSDTAVGTAVTYCTVTVSTGLRMPYDTFHDAVTLVADPLIEALAPVNVGTAGLPYA